MQAQFFEFSAGETLPHWYGHHAGELNVPFLDMELHKMDGMLRLENPVGGEVSQNLSTTKGA